MKYAQKLLNDIPLSKDEDACYEINKLKQKFPSKDIWVGTVTYYDGEIKDKVFLSIERDFDYDKDKDGEIVVIKDMGWKLLFSGSLFLQSAGHRISDYWTTDVDMDFETALELQEKINEAVEWAKETDLNLDKIL